MEAHRYPWIGYTAAALMAIVLLALVFGRDLRLPGLFMDSINPEYMSVKAVNDDARPDTPTLVMAGNIIDGKYPVLAGSYYHGPLQFYVALPVYAVLGTNIVSARVVQGLYGVFILLGIASIARRYPIRLGVAATMLALLAIDPAFSLALKTQAYNVMWPLVWMLLAIAATESWATRRVPPRAWQLLWSGLLLGVAFFCYFVFLFFVPALALYLVHCLRLSGVRGIWQTVRALVINGIGFSVGGLGYLAGYKLAADEVGGWRKFIESNQSTVHGMVVEDQPITLLQRLEIAWHWLQTAISDNWVSRMVLGEDSSSRLGSGKAIALIALPLLLLALLRYWKVRSRLLELCIALSASFFAATLLFGAKISGHHYTVLLPLLYLGIAAGISDAWPNIAARVKLRVPLAALAVSCALILAADSLIAQAGFSKRLRETGGVGYYSDAIDRYAAQALATKRETTYFFPEWGLMMPFVFLTGGREDTEVVEPAHDDIARLVCSGSAVEVAYLQGQRAAAFAGRVHGGAARLAPRLRTLEQRDGVSIVGSALYLPPTDREGIAACASFRPPAYATWTRNPASRIGLAPSATPSCTDGGVIPVRVDWDVSASGASQVAIWVSNGDQRALWMTGAATGSSMTGPWVSAGAGFEVLDGRTGERLATATIGCKR